MKVKYAWESLQGATSQCRNAAAKLIFRPHTFDINYVTEVGRQARRKKEERKMGTLNFCEQIIRPANLFSLDEFEFIVFFPSKK